MNYNLDALKNESLSTRIAFEEVLIGIERIKNGIAYCTEAIESDIEKWEEQEYMAVKSDYEEELKEKENHLNMLLEMYPQVVDKNYTGETVFLYCK